MTDKEEQAFLKRHIEDAQAGEFVTVNQLFEAYQKEIGRTSWNSKHLSLCTWSDIKWPSIISTPL